MYKWTTSSKGRSSTLSLPIPIPLSRGTKTPPEGQWVGDDEVFYISPTPRNQKTSSSSIRSPKVPPADHNKNKGVLAATAETNLESTGHLRKLQPLGTQALSM